MYNKFNIVYYYSILIYYINIVIMLGYRRDITNVINTQLNMFDICLNQLEYRVDGSFADVNTRLGVLDGSFIKVNTRLGVLDGSFADVYNKIQQIDNINEITNTALFVNDVSQTFYEIITQQPYKFDRTDISINPTSIILRWNYNSIIAKHSNNNIAKLANISDTKQNLPFINEIVIEISQNNLSWTNITNLTINSDYNVDNFKYYTYQRVPSFNNDVSFSIRVYGKNYSNNYPNIESRSLVFNNLTFSLVNPPSKPLFIESNVSYVSNINNIVLTYFNTLTDYLDSSSSAIVTNYIIDYSLNDTLASNSLVRNLLATTSLANIQNNITGNFANDISSNSNFDISITNLMSGANYNHSVKVKNNFSNVYSQYSTISGSKYTLLPNNNNIDTSINMSINRECYKNITTSILDNSSILYFNIDNSSHSFFFDNSYAQVFQITHPYFNNQQLTTYGYGKYVDNRSNLVAISLKINDVQKHVINYGGYNTNTRSYNYSKNDYDRNKLFILNNTTNNINDIYDASINIGFRLKGYLLFKPEITNTNIVNYFGDPSSSPYVMNLNYERHIDVSNLDNINNSYNIYIDNLSNNPSISNVTNTILIEEVVYNMGVASVKYFKVILTRTYSNINSIYKYIVGNRRIADFSYNNSIVTSFSKENIILKLEQSDICANGVYNYDLCYNIAFYQEVKDHYNFTLLEKAYNLNGYTSSNISLTTKPFCDYNSFNKSNNIIATSKLDLTALHIYEISNIALLGSDLTNIVLKHYISHNNEILPSSLLYLNSSFSNVFSSYPNSTDFSYNNNNNLDISYSTYGNISYNLDGSISNNNEGYKWIVFEIKKNSNNVSNSYLFNDISYNIIITNDGRYLPLKTMLTDNNLFSHSIVDKIFDITDTSALMFGHATTRSNSTKRYFNIKQPFNPGGGIWTENSISDNISYNITANSPISNIFGSNVNNNGIYCPITDLNNDLTIYIGLKQ